MHPDFESFSISAVSIDRPLVGRPQGGLCKIWRKTIGLKYSIRTFEVPRLLGVVIESLQKKIYILNVYLPYYSNDNTDLYLHYIGLISSIIEDYDH